MIGRRAFVGGMLAAGLGLLSKRLAGTTAEVGQASAGAPGPYGQISDWIAPAARSDWTLQIVVYRGDGSVERFSMKCDDGPVEIPGVDAVMVRGDVLELHETGSQHA